MHQFPILCSQLGQDSFRTFELCAVDGLSTCAVTFGEVSTLKHELRYDTMEARALVTKTVTSGREFTEVLRGLGDDVVEELECDTTGVLAVDCDVELRARTSHQGDREAEWVYARVIHERGSVHIARFEDDVR